MKACDIDAWADWPAIVQVFDVETGKERDYIFQRTCQRVVYKPTGVLVCSECGAGIPKQLDKYCYLHYCPNCGAKVVEQ